jgi:hypothetical protein
MEPGRMACPGAARGRLPRAVCRIRAVWASRLSRLGLAAELLRLAAELLRLAQALGWLGRRGLPAALEAGCSRRSEPVAS